MTPDQGTTTGTRTYLSVERFVFLAELVAPPDNSERSVRFRYVIDGSAELSLPREWWEQLGAPEEIEVSLEPNAD